MPSSVAATIVVQALGPTIGAIAGNAFAAMILRAVLTYALTQVIRSAIGGNAKDSKAESSKPSATVSNRMLTIREPVSPWQVIYGEVRTGGRITFASNKANKNVMHLVITLTGHEVEEIGDIYFNDELVPLDGSGNATHPQYANYVKIVKSLGDEGVGVQPFPDLVTESSSDWASTHRQSGRAKLWVRLTANPASFPNGMPNITAVVRGRKVVDPRVSPSVDTWTANAALCVHDYLTHPVWGFGADAATEIDQDSLIAAANLCDEAVTLAGSPTTTEARYEANGSFMTSARPSEVLGRLLAAMAGKAVNAGGQWHLFGGAYEAPTLTLDESDLAGPIRVQTLVSRRENANGVKGKFTNPDAHWQPDDLPPVASDTYMAEDGGVRIWKDIDLSQFVTSASQGQRLEKIELLSLRQGLTVEATFKLTAWRAMTGRTIALDNARLGWSGKAFEVVSSKFVVGDEGQLNVQLQLRETAAAVFDWSTSEEQAADLAPNTNLPDPLADLDIATPTATSGTTDLLLNGDGTVVPRVRLRWTAPDNPFITVYEIQVDRGTVSPSEWSDCPPVVAPATEGFALPVTDGESVNLRVRARTSFGNAGAWSYVYGHTVVGKTAAPSNVTGFSAAQSGGSVVFSCNSVEDADLDLIEIRLGDEGNTSWGDATALTNILRGQTATSAAVPPGTWTFLAKARDTSGNYSATAASATVTVTATGFTTISATEFAPAWTGALTNMVRHWTGVLTPDSQSLASALDWEVFDQFVPNAYTDCYFEAPEIDKTLSASARVYADIVSVLGPGETTGSAAPTLEIDYKTSSGSYDGFEPWTIGNAEFRYLKGRIHVDTTVGKPVVSGFAITIDAEARDETGSLTVGAGGSGSVTFTNPFHSTPVIQLTAQGSGDVSASFASASGTGFTGYFKTAGVAGAGTMNYTATGV